MKDFNIIVFPYRDAYFLDKYGAAVRDLQIIGGLGEINFVEKITIINRPVSIYERMSNKRQSKYFSSDLATTIDITSYDPVGPIFKRRWLNVCFDKYDFSHYYDEKCINVVLDFMPIGYTHLNKLKYDVLWYDLIDNFEKHNRYSIKEKSLVSEKYSWIAANADIVTGVSEKCVSRFDSAFVMSNAAGIAPYKKYEELLDNTLFDFGFVGFITDKFDVEFVKLLAENGYKVAIFGEFYDKSIYNILMSFSNIYMHGAFRHDDLPEIVRMFKVGIIPYLENKLHDESPLKLYQYLLHGRPVITSVRFEISDVSVQTYQGLDSEQILLQAKQQLAFFEKNRGTDIIRNVISPDDYWVGKLDKILKRIRNLYSGTSD